MFADCADRIDACCGEAMEALAAMEAALDLLAPPQGQVVHLLHLDVRIYSSSSAAASASARGRPWLGP